MKKNVGGIDRTIRIVLGVVILAAGVYYGSWWGALGLLPLATAAFSFCPLWVPFGISTRK